MLYRKRAELLEVADRYVSNEEAAMYFAAADLAVLPYREATGSGVLQLTFDLGEPVVDTRTGGMSDAAVCLQPRSVGGADGGAEAHAASHKPLCI